LDILTGVIPNTTPGSPPQQVFITLNGSAAELEALLMAIQKALSGGPQVFETRAMNGVPTRILIDRLGPPQVQGG